MEQFHIQREVIFASMKEVCFIVLKFVLSFFRKRMSIQTENAALRQQLKVYKRKDRKPKIKPTDRMFWSLISQIWSGWEDALYFVKPATVVSWRRKKYRGHWTKLYRNVKSRGPSVDQKAICLIRNISKANPLLGTPQPLMEDYP